MIKQESVDFSNYDLVDIVYLQSSKSYNGSKIIIPFYAFYKKIGIAENGNEIYAKTYVPAIQVSGYEEYFKSQEAMHNNWTHGASPAGFRRADAVGWKW